jgi:hypothetical protein
MIDMQRVNLKNLNGEVREQYPVTITYKFAALENLKRTVETSIGHGTMLEASTKFRPKGV